MSGDCTAAILYIEWDPLFEVEKPFELFVDIPPDVEDQRSTNIHFCETSTQISDVRGQEDTLSLDENGFIYRSHITKITDFADPAVIEEQYIPEMEELLKMEVDGADKVFVFNWKVRSCKHRQTLEDSVEEKPGLNLYSPATQAHLDQSPAGALHRIRKHMKDEAEDLLKSRVRIINVWRPLVTAVGDWPVGLVDGRTLSEGDLIEVDHLHKNHAGSAMYLQYNPKQRFSYLSEQRRDEVLIFKNFDSKSVQSRWAPHAAFQHPSPPSDVQPRESIEIRALVFTHPSDGLKDA